MRYPSWQASEPGYKALRETVAAAVGRASPTINEDFEYSASGIGVLRACQQNGRAISTGSFTGSASGPPFADVYTLFNS